MARRNSRHLEFRNSLQRQSFAGVGMDYFSLIRLTGYFAVCGMSQVLLHSIRRSYPEAIPYVICRGKVEIRQHIFFNQFRTILSLIEIPDKLQGRLLGLRILNAQVKQAQHASIKQFRAIAYRENPRANQIQQPLMKEKWVGYQVWAKLGFVMIPASEVKFQHFLKERNIPPMSLRELQGLPPNPAHPFLQQGGAELWAKEGWTWIGTFDLQSGSESLSILEEYKMRKRFKE